MLHDRQVEMWCAAGARCWLLRGLLLALLPIFVLNLAACGLHREPPVPPRQAPGTLGISAAEAYTASDAAVSAPDPASICALEPERCPTLNLLGSTGSPSVDRSSSYDVDSGSELLLTGPLSAAPAVSRRPGTMGEVFSSRAESKVTATGPRAAPEPARRSGTAAPLKLREIEAHITVQVADIPSAVAQTRKFVHAAGGEVVNEVFEDTSSEHGSALSIRVPVAKTNLLLGQLSGIGRVQSRKVQSQDISRKYLDAELLLKNLRAALTRYEALLGRATEVSEIAGIEASLARLRTQIDRVEGDLRWLADLGARSTIYLKLTSAHEQEFVAAPEAKLWPGVRALALIDLAPNATPRSYAGGALTFLVQRSLSFDVAVLRDLTDDDVSLFSASIGGEMYSDYLGGGRRRWFNPYLGFRAAYMHHDGFHEAAVGATLGIELLRTDTLLVDLQARGYAAFASKLGLHALLEPGLGLNVAF